MVSEELAASIFSVSHSPVVDPEDGGSALLQSIGALYTSFHGVTSQKTRVFNMNAVSGCNVAGSYMLTADCSGVSLLSQLRCLRKTQVLM